MLWLHEKDLQMKIHFSHGHVVPWAFLFTALVTPNSNIIKMTIHMQLQTIHIQTTIAEAHKHTNYSQSYHHLGSQRTMKENTCTSACWPSHLPETMGDFLFQNLTLLIPKFNTLVEGQGVDSAGESNWWHNPTILSCIVTVLLVSVSWQNRSDNQWHAKCISIPI